MLTPLAQEISGKECDVGLERGELEREVERLLSDEEEGTKGAFGKIDFGEVEEGWCLKVRHPFLSLFPLFYSVRSSTLR